MKGKLKVYWATSSGEVHSDEVDRIEGGEVYFADGQWNPLDSCFLTERQCRRAKKLAEPPPAKVYVAARVALSLMERAVAKFKEILPDDN